MVSVIVNAMKVSNSDYSSPVSHQHSHTHTHTHTQASPVFSNWSSEVLNYMATLCLPGKHHAN